MKTSVIMTLVLALGIAFAGIPTSDVPVQEPARFYYGLPGSNDYVQGTVTPDNPTDAWALHSNMPAQLMDNCCAANATHSYVLSGYNTSHPKTLFRHATGSTTWETMAPPPQEISNGGCAIIGDTLYYCSGYSYSFGGTKDTLWKYSIAGNDWTSGPGPFTGTTYNWQAFVLACQGKLYYISGCNQPGAANPTTQVHCYTPGSGWAPVADMHQGRVFAQGWVYNDTIWMAGGNTGSGITHTEFYDPVADTWTVDNTVFPQLPYGVWGAGSGAVGNTAFIASGVKGDALQDTCMYFDHSTHTWTISAGMHLKIYRTAGVGTADGKAVLYGGSTGGFVPTNVCQYEQLSTGHDHDVGVTQIMAPNGSVTPTPPITPKALIKNFGTNAESNIPVTCWIDSAGTRVYDHNVVHAGPLAPGASAEVTFSPDWSGVAGNTYNVTMLTSLSGDEERSNDTAHATVSVVAYTVTWTAPTHITPCAVSRVACVTEPVTDGYLVHVVCGNCQAHTSHPNDEIYDPVANTWTTGLTHPAGGGKGVHNHDAVLINDVIWCGGGSWGSAYYNNLSKLDLGAGTWTEATAMPATDLLYYSFEEDGQYLYCFGGVSGTTVRNNCDRYDPVANSWTAMANMPGPRRNPMTAHIDDTIYVIGGMQQNNYTSTRGTVWKYSIAGNDWTVATDTMPDNLGWGKAVAYHEAFLDRVYVWGGYRQGAYANACWRYNLTSGTWAEDRPMLSTNRSHGGDIFGNEIWSAGGWNGSILNSMHKGTISPTGIEEGKPSVGWDYGFDRVAPTVVRNFARISYSVPKQGRVNLGVYDASGSLVRTLVDEVLEPGSRTVTWNRADNNGQRVANGTYFYRLTINGKSVSAKAVVLN